MWKLVDRRNGQVSVPVGDEIQEQSLNAGQSHLGTIGRLQHNKVGNGAEAVQGSRVAVRLCDLCPNCIFYFSLIPHTASVVATQAAACSYFTVLNIRLQCNAQLTMEFNPSASISAHNKDASIMTMLVSKSVSLMSAWLGRLPPLTGSILGEASRNWRKVVRSQNYYIMNEIDEVRMEVLEFIKDKM